MNVNLPILLFDIDDTLLTSGGAGAKALRETFEQMFRIKNAFDGAHFSGKTDPQIIREGLEKHGLEIKLLAVVQKKYLFFLRRFISNPQKKLFPGVKKALTLLKEKGYPLGILTGNFIEGAEIKLSAFDLNSFFIAGAFGSDSDDRNQLLPFAVKRFEKKGIKRKAKEIILIGDTPRDITCAKVYKAKAVGVCTGMYKRTDLLEADLVLDSLLEIDKFFLWLEETKNTI